MSSMVHYIVWYMLTQSKLQYINNVTFNIHQQLWHNVMFIKGYVAVGVHQVLCHIVTLINGYIALQQSQGVTFIKPYVGLRHSTTLILDCDSHPWYITWHFFHITTLIKAYNWLQRSSLLHSLMVFLHYEIHRGFSWIESLVQPRFLNSKFLHYDIHWGLCTKFNHACVWYMLT